MTLMDDQTSSTSNTRKDSPDIPQTFEDAVKLIGAEQVKVHPDDRQFVLQSIQRQTKERGAAYMKKNATMLRNQMEMVLELM